MFYPTGRTCSAVSPFCNGHNVQTGACFACSYGLQFNSGVCTDPNCIQSSPKSCTSCNSGYKADSNGVCQFYDVNCATYSEGFCVSCNNGYYINIKGVCLVLPSNCKFANVAQANTCIQCNDGFVVTNGVCIQQNVIPNCATVQNGQCANCNSGYYVKSGTCEKVSFLC